MLRVDAMQSLNYNQTTSSCRICLSPNTTEDVSSLPTELHVESSGQDIIKFCLNIEMTEHTSNHSKLCTSCNDSIISFYLFKVLAQRSDEYLRALKDKCPKEMTISLNENIKLEFGEVLVKEEDLYDREIVPEDDADILQEYATNFKDESSDDNSSYLKTSEEDTNAIKLKPSKKKVPCQICGCLFVSIMYMERHIIRIHRKETQFSCHDCNAGFYLKEALEIHIRRDHLEKACRYCQKLYKKDQLTMHILTTHLKLPKIEKVYTKLPIKEKLRKVIPKIKRQKLRRNLKQEPKDRKRFRCDICGKNLSGAISLERHHTRVHLMQRDECPLCQKNVSNLSTHIRHNHGEKPFACKQCPKKFARLKLLEAHKVMHSDARPFKCPTCDTACKTKYLLDSHIRSIHNGEQRYLCQICSKGFFKKFHLDRHMRSHGVKTPRQNISQTILKVVSNVEETQDLPCEFCSKTFTSTVGLEKHMCSHLQEKRFFCNDCDSSYYVMRALEMHIRKNHLKQLEQSSDVCPICGKTFHNLENHLRTHQPKALRSTFECDLCKKAYASKIGLKRHQMYVHNRHRVKCTICDKEVAHISIHMKRLHTPRLIPCSACPLTFVNEAHLRSHAVLHMDERPFECTQCGKFYKSNHALDRHTRAVHLGEKKFLCQVCSKGFFSKDKFERHLRSHSDELKYKCDICGKAMKTREGLLAHMDNHQGVRNYECTVCGIGFARSGAYYAHKLSHTDEKKYECRICGKRYKRTNHRNRHEVMVHGKRGKKPSVETLKQESDDTS